MTDYTDIIARLRLSQTGGIHYEAADALEAQARRIAGYQKDADDYLIRLDELNSLRARIAELEALLRQTNEGYAECIAAREDLKEALATFADAADSIPAKLGDDYMWNDAFPAGAIRKARAAYLGEKE